MAERKTESVMMKKKLLIIEDDMDLAKITSDMLKSYGYEVETV